MLPNFITFIFVLFTFACKTTSTSSSSSKNIDHQETNNEHILYQSTSSDGLINDIVLPPDKLKQGKKPSLFLTSKNTSKGKVTSMNCFWLGSEKMELECKSMIIRFSADRLTLISSKGMTWKTDLITYVDQKSTKNYSKVRFSENYDAQFVTDQNGTTTILPCSGSSYKNQTILTCTDLATELTDIFKISEDSNTLITEFGESLAITDPDQLSPNELLQIAGKK